MKILVLSDSHCALSFMRLCIQKVKPDHVVHLGDHYDDGAAMAQENPHIIFHQVPGNCDRFRCDAGLPEVICYPIGGVRFFMTHGHKHAVKTGLDTLLAAAKEANAQAVLFGHTHRALCYRLSDMWVMNPGTCGSYGGSVGVIETQNNEISACYLLEQADLEKL